MPILNLVVSIPVFCDLKDYDDGGDLFFFHPIHQLIIAGYCVITYLLGVGDRHLDNLLMTKTGRLFHIDFGFILGRDPKLSKPPMKITREMVDAMGGMDSENFYKFCSFVRTAFLHLRRHANLILNLFSLMIDANVPDIALEPDKTVQKVQDKFKLELNDEQADHYITEQVEQSVRSIMPVVVDQLHKMAQVCSYFMETNFSFFFS